VVARLEEVLVAGLDHPAIDVQRHLHHPLAVASRTLATELDEALGVRRRVAPGRRPLVLASLRDAVGDAFLDG
jgi:hypothetical protein